MKKRLLVLLPAILITAFFLSLPLFVGSAVTPVSFSYPTQTNDSAGVLASGRIEKEMQINVTSEFPVVIKEYAVYPGDSVQAGDVIAYVDVMQTKEMLLTLAQTASIIPEEYKDVLSNIKLDESLLSSVIPPAVYAPANGTVLSVGVFVGEMASPTDTVAVVARGDTLVTVLEVDESEVESIAVGDRVIVKASATGGKQYGGIVTEIAPAAQQVFSGTQQQTVVQVRACLSSQADELRPGYPVSAQIQKKDQKTVLTVPYESVAQDDDGQEYVYVYEDGRAVRRDVVTGKEFSDCVAIESGIDKEDLIIGEAAQILRDGVRVTQKEAS